MMFVGLLTSAHAKKSAKAKKETTEPAKPAAAAKPQAGGCIDMYTTAFKNQGPKIDPAEVGELYMTYCKKNMRVSSAKSMDELCGPIVKKVEEKMRWVPQETSVTPEIVCKTIDQLKEQFPEHAKVTQAQAGAEMDESRKQDAAKQELGSKAKELSTKFGEDLKASVAEASEILAKGFRQKMEIRAKEVLGSKGEGPAVTKMLSAITEQLTLGLRGLETKANQKRDEAMKEWVATAARDLKNEL